MMRAELQTLYDKQFKDLKRSYDELNIQRQKDLKESLEQKTSEYEQELRQKDMKYKELHYGLAGFKANAIEEAKASVRNELLEREIQISRLKEKADDLGKQLSQTQSELKGEVGETNLLMKLREKFQEEGDIFIQETRGSSGPDVIQHIKGTSGKLLKNIIAYDNKEAACISREDIEKAKRDKKALETDYFIIVSCNLPKRDAKNGLYEERGILLIHPSIVVPMAGIIRRAIIEIARQSASMRDQSQETSMAA